MNPTVVSLAVVSVAFATWMLHLSRKASRGALGRSGPGIRVTATKVCEHTWDAAQRAAVPRYRELAFALLGVGVVAVVLDLAGVESSTAVIVWFVGAIGAQVVLLARASSAAAAAATAVRCEHQSDPKPERPARSGRPAPSRRTNAGRGGRGKGARRR